VRSIRKLEYIPSSERTRKRVAHDLEFENADLRRRLEAMAKALEVANYKLREISTWGGHVEMQCRELVRACSTISGLAFAPLGKTQDALAVEVHARDNQKTRRTLYVASRRYGRQ
jgi:hypothetical protein